MTDLFESDEWKRLKAVDSSGPPKSSKNIIFDLNGNVESSQAKANDQGEWLWHALTDIYLDYRI